MGPSTPLGSALDELRRELQALAPEDVRLPRIDVDRAVELVMEAQSRVESRLDEIRAVCPSFDPASVHRIRLAALALRDANAAVKRDPDLRRRMSDLLAEARSTRRLLMKTAALAELLGEPMQPPLLEMRRRQEPRAIAEDLIQLSSGLTGVWGRVEAQVPLTRTQLDRAPVVAEALLRALDEGFETERESVDLRNRAFTILRDRYEEMRRVVTYVRWHEGDAKEIVPSLFTLRRRRVGSRYSRPARTPAVHRTRPSGVDRPFPV